MDFLSITFHEFLFGLDLSPGSEIFIIGVDPGAGVIAISLGMLTDSFIINRFTRSCNSSI